MANIFDQFDVNTPTKNVTSTPNIFDKFDDNKVNDGTTVSNIPQLKNFPKSFLESAYEDVKETGSDVADFFKDVYSSSMRSFEKAEEANRMAQEKAGKIFGGATVELVTALPELISNVAKIAAPETSKEIAESPIGQAYSKVLNTINPELSKEEDIAKTILSLATGVGAGIKAGKILSDLLVKKFGRDKSQKIAVELNKLVDTKSAASVSKAVDTIPVKTTKILAPTVASSAAAIQLDVQQRKEDQQFISPLALYLNDAIGPEASDWLKENAGVDLVSVGRSLQINPNDTEAQKLLKQYKDAAALDGIGIGVGTLAVALIKSGIKPAIKLKEALAEPVKRTKEVIVDTVGKVNTGLGRRLTSKSSMPQKIYDAEIERKFAPKSIEFDTKVELKKLKKLQKKEKVSDEMFNNYFNTGVDDGLSPAFKKEVDKFTTKFNKNESDIADSLGLPPENRLGVRSDGQDFYITRSFEATTDPVLNENIRRILQKNPTAWAKITGKKSDAHLEGLIDNVRVELKKNGVTDVDSQDAIMVRMLENVSPSNTSVIKDIFEGTTSSLPKILQGQSAKILKTRKDMTKPFLELLGEVKDPYKNIQNTLINQEKLLNEIKFWQGVEDIAKQTMGKDIELGGLASFLPRRLESFGRDTGKRNVSLNSLVEESLGKFGGNNIEIGKDIFVSDYFGKMLSKGLDFYNPVAKTKAGRALSKAASAAQAKETLVDPAAYSLNTWGVGQSLVGNGHLFNPLTYGRAIKATNTWVQQFAKNDPKSTELLSFLKRKGVIDQDVTGEAIAQNAKNLNGVTPFSKGMELFGRAYGQPDFFGKIVAFEAERASLKAQFPFRKWNSTKPEYEDYINNEAAAIVRDTMPTYGIAPPLARLFARVPLLGNFTLFATELTRTTANIAKRGVKDFTLGIANGNARQTAAGVRRLAGLATVVAGTDYTVDKLRQYMNYDDNTLKAFQILAAPYAKGSKVIPLEPLVMDETGKEKLTLKSVMKQFPRENWDEISKEKQFKGSYQKFIRGVLKQQRENFVPYIRTRAGSTSAFDMFDYIKAPIRLVFAKLFNNGQMSDAEIDKAFGNAAQGVTGPFTSPKFLANAVMGTILGVDPVSKKSIYDEAAGATPKEKIISAAESIMKAFKGGGTKAFLDYMDITSSEELLGVGRAENKSGQPLDRQGLITYLTSGARFRPLNLNKRIGLNLSLDIKAIDKLSSNFQQVMKDEKRTLKTSKDVDRIVKEYVDLQERKRTAMQNLSKKIDIFQKIPYMRVYRDKNGKKETSQETIGKDGIIKAATDNLFYNLKPEIVQSLIKPIVTNSAQGIFIPDQEITDNLILTLKKKGYPIELLSELGQKLGKAQIKLTRGKLFDKPKSGSNIFDQFDEKGNK